VRAAFHEVGAQQQVLGRIAAHRELGCDHDRGAAGARALREIEDAIDVAREVSDRRVHLRNRNSHRPNISSASMIPRYGLHSPLSRFHLMLRRRCARCVEPTQCAQTAAR
jgi:hypothetical protein